MRLIVICGATASGKSALAVALAQLCQGEIVSCDSMQVYIGMNIGTATPDEAEMCGIKHHLISVLEPTYKLSAAAYRDMAKPVIEDIVSRGKTPILCGGTGLYIDSLTKPLGFVVEGREEIRARLNAISEQPGGREKLHAELEKVDPETASRLHFNNLRRVIRALEVYEITKIPLSKHMQKDCEREADFDASLYAIDWPRDVLYDRINARVDKMMDMGLLNEATELMRDAGDERSTAFQAIGYKELGDVIKGERDIAQAIEEIKINTRHYAKRQLTWFRNDPRVKWLHAGDISEMAEYIRHAEGL